MELKKIVKDKRFLFASFLITWAAALQGHMMWLKRQDNFKHKFGTQNQQNGVATIAVKVIAMCRELDWHLRLPYYVKIESM